MSAPIITWTGRKGDGIRPVVLMEPNAMAFDAATYPTPTAANQADAPESVLCPVWAAENPDRALAFLYVAPHDGPAVDALIAA